jgi:murein hydrolase activator
MRRVRENVSRREPSASTLAPAAPIAAGRIAAGLVALAALASLLILAFPAYAADQGTGVDQKLKTVEHALEKDKAHKAELDQRAAEIAGERDALRQKLIDGARATQDQEQQITDLENTLMTLNAQEKDETADLIERRVQLGVTLGALERMAIYPPEALAALPEAPVDTVRSAILLRAAIPEVEARADRLRDDLNSLRELRVEIYQQEHSLADAKSKLDNDHRRLASLLEQKDQLFRATEAERATIAARLAQLSGQAKDLHDLMDKVEADRILREAERNVRRDSRKDLAGAAAPTPPADNSSGPSLGSGGEQLASLPPASTPAGALKPPNIRPIGQAAGHLTLPARGEVVREFGVADSAGSPTKGLTIRTRDNAQVVAPYDGQVVFAGPFRGYGQILIIEHSEGYHTLLSGLSRIDAVAGQWVLAGEPIGVMGPGAGGAPELYVELRRNGRPINPLPWLAFHNGKVSG